MQEGGGIQKKMSQEEEEDRRGLKSGGKMRGRDFKTKED